MARFVRVQGESAYTHMLDLDLNPWAEDQIASGRLKVIEELDELPPDPWAPKPARGKRSAPVSVEGAASEPAGEG